jgi:L-serine/L-threonine ammonia-lyase
MKALHIETPVFYSNYLSKSINKKVYLKMECFQETGSFKIRGLGYLCQHEYNQGKQKFISSSGGNAGFAVTWAGMKMQIPVDVYVPETTPETTQAFLRNRGAQVFVAGREWDDTHKLAVQAAENEDAAYIHPFDHPLIHFGHSGMVDEIKFQAPKPDVIILSVGGGGLLCGVVEGLIRNSWSDVQVLAVETTGSASFNLSLQLKSLVSLDKIDTIATSLGARKVCQQAFNFGINYPVFSQLVSDQDTLNACRLMANEQRVLIEPASGASIAALFSQNEILQKAENIIVIVCGGIGVNLNRLQEWESKLQT